MINPLEMTLATPKYSVGKGYPGTIYLRTMTVYIKLVPSDRNVPQDMQNHAVKEQSSKRRRTEKRTTYHTARQSARQERKSQKEDESNFPRDPAPKVVQAIGRQAGFLNRVDHEHSQRRTYSWNPIDEFDMDIRAVLRAVGEGSGVDEEEKAEGELEKAGQGQ